MKKAIIIYGPPGSGKSTQAELITRATHAIHFDSGRFIRNLIFSPQASRDPIIRRQRKLYDEGKLSTPSWFLKYSKAAGHNASSFGASIVYSGSPRTMYEAFDGTKRNGLMKELSKDYGKKNVFIIELSVRENTSLKRNMARYICSICGLPRLSDSPARRCSFCGGSFKKRRDDKKKVMEVRLREYRERTEPIIARAKKGGYVVKRVDGERLPYQIHIAIRKILKI